MRLGSSPLLRLLCCFSALALDCCSAGSAGPLGNPRTAQGGNNGVGTGTGGSPTTSSGGGFDLNVSGSTGVSASGQPFGCPTTVSGTVYDPSGKLPLYNVVVYVPSEALAPIQNGASCQTCDGNFSGHPIAATLSDAAGHFQLQLDNVPATDTLPIVVQVGKWRRQINVAGVKACADTEAAPGSVRLPRDRSEGALPRIAVVRGGSDALECLFRKIGLADSEFSTDSGDGRIQLYASDDGTAEAGTTQLASGGSIPLAGTLYSSLDKLMSYDAVFMACEGGGKGTFQKYDASVFGNVAAYADRGGRIFGSHYQNYWIRPDKFDFPAYPAVAVFASSQHGFDVDVTGDVDTSFPKGVAFRDWLVNVSASTTPGKLLIHDGEHTVDSVVPGEAQQWITVDDPSGHRGVVQYYSFNTPVGKPECGRMVFSDLHVASGTGDSGKLAFPTGCTSSVLSPQEKALAFMLFRSLVLRTSGQRSGGSSGHPLNAGDAGRSVYVGYFAETFTAPGAVLAIRQLPTARGQLRLDCDKLGRRIPLRSAPFCRLARVDRSGAARGGPVQALMSFPASDYPVHLDSSVPSPDCYSDRVCPREETLARCRATPGDWRNQLQGPRIRQGVEFS